MFDNDKPWGGIFSDPLLSSLLVISHGRRQREQIEIQRDIADQLRALNEPDPTEPLFPPGFDWHNLPLELRKQAREDEEARQQALQKRRRQRKPSQRRRRQQQIQLTAQTWPFYLNGLPVAMLIPQALPGQPPSSHAPPVHLHLEPKPNGTWWVVADQTGSEMTGYGAFTSQETAQHFIHTYFPNLEKP